jgi:hypothetical protein
MTVEKAIVMPTPLRPPGTRDRLALRAAPAPAPCRLARLAAGVWRHRVVLWVAAMAAVGAAMQFGIGDRLHQVVF